YRIRDLHDLLHGDGGRMSEDLAGRLQPGEGVPPLAGDGLNGLGALHWSLLSFPAAVCAACAGAGHAWRRTPAALACRCGRWWCRLLRRRVGSVPRSRLRPGWIGGESGRLAVVAWATPRLCLTADHMGPPLPGRVSV